MSVRNAALALAMVMLALTAAPRVASANGGALRPYYPAEAYNQDHDYPVVELVTMGIGSLIWERHGHIALCVVYENRADDACYNYGVGDFRHPVDMGVGFFRGAHSFWVDKEPPMGMLRIYTGADRAIYVQPLPLDQAQKHAVIDKLEHDILEDNKYYAYDHFGDNCTTRIRDIIDHVTGGKLSAMTAENPNDDRTYRDYARAGFFGMRIPLLITDMAMGRSTDRVPSFYDRMFLPQYIREAVTQLWGVKPIEIYKRKGPPPLDDGPSGRVLFALVILLATCPVWLTRLWGRFERAGIAFAILPPVVLGIAFWVLALISPLPYVRWNESCLIFFPLDLLLLVLPAPRRRLYARGRVGMLALVAVLLAVGVLEQPLWAPMLWPLIPALVVGFWPVQQRSVATTQVAAAPAEPGRKRKAFGKRATQIT